MPPRATRLKKNATDSPVLVGPSQRQQRVGGHLGLLIDPGQSKSVAALGQTKHARLAREITSTTWSTYGPARERHLPPPLEVESELGE
jgi:hypothetical protein